MERKDLPIVPAIFPMPVVLIATDNEDGTVDVMNAAWVTAYDFTQVKLNLADDHLTTENINRTKRFSIALADVAHMKEADYVGLVSGRKVKDKVQIAGFNISRGTVLDVPVLEDFPLIMECEALPFDGEYGVVAEIKRLAVKQEHLDENGKVDVSKLQIIAYDPLNHGYYVVDKKVGQAFFEGRKLK